MSFFSAVWAEAEYLWKHRGYPWEELYEFAHTEDKCRCHEATVQHESQAETGISGEGAEIDVPRMPKEGADVHVRGARWKAE